MTRAPFVMGKAEAAFPRNAEDLRHHHRLALRQPDHEGPIRRRCDAARPPRTSPTTSRSSREDQDAFALRSQQRAGRAIAAGFFAEEIVPVAVPAARAPTVVDKDEHPRADTTLERSPS